MKTNASQSRVTRLFTYPVASADMYSSEEYQRTVCICDDPKKGFKIWGEIPDIGQITAVNLCQILLEYAMTCSAMGDQSQAFRQMEIFGDRLGRLLANHIEENAPMEKADYLAACGLECIIESLDVTFTIEQDGAELRFILSDCPVDENARRTGLGHIELARHGMEYLCRNLISAIDADLVVDTPGEADVKPVFTLKLAAVGESLEPSLA